MQKRSMNSKGHGMMSHWLYWQRGGHCVGVRGARIGSLPEIFKREQPGKGSNHIVEYR